MMRIPAQVLLAFASCASTTGTAAASITPDVSVMAGRVVVAFTYTDASTAGCQLNGIKSIDFVDDSGTKHANLEELQHTPIGAAGATGSYFGKTKSGVPAAAVGTSVTVNVTFNVKETLWCHTCTPSPVTASAKATVK
ncbi:MAG: hypothetical protein JOY86_05025 [Candidatus Eremiobacteraeota bacterium]|nr:hypothetical protein [Candidatus Eremiobacteraeota bacterium]